MSNLQSLVVSETKCILETTGEDDIDCLRLESPKWMEVSDEVLRYLQKAVKNSSRDCRIVQIVLQNNQRDEAGISGEELSSLLSDLKKRMKKVSSLTVNLDHWGLLFMVLPNIAEQLSSFGNNQLLELTMISNNKSLNPSVTNKTVRTLGLVLKDLTSLKKLELQLDDNSTQKKKQIEKEGFSSFCEGLAGLSNLISLDLQLGGWFSFFRHHIKEQDASMEEFSQAISRNKKQLQNLRLSLKYWEDVEFNHLTLICKSLVSNQVALQLKTCSLDFIRWSYFNSSNQQAAVDSLAELIHDLRQCNVLSISFFNLGTGFQEQRDFKRNSISVNQNNYHQGNNLARDNHAEIVSASPDLLKLFVNQIINKKNKLKALELSIHEYVAIGGMKVLRDSLFGLSSLTSLKISTQSEPYEAKKYLSTLVAVPKCRKRAILFLQACKKSERLKLFRKDFLVHLACISFNLEQNQYK